eukprot:355521-Chlamydomonas_euryale.AAC.1
MDFLACCRMTRSRSMRGTSLAIALCALEIAFDRTTSDSGGEEFIVYCRAAALQAWRHQAMRLFHADRERGY